MSASTPSLRPAREDPAPVFAALGDPTRLSLVARLCGGRPRSITDLAQGSPLSRQAIAKHLRVLEAAGLVGHVRAGRESLFELRPQRIAEVRVYLEEVSRQWDQALGRLKAFVEEGGTG